jgi:hypothetical protein
MNRKSNQNSDDEPLEEDEFLEEEYGDEIGEGTIVRPLRSGQVTNDVDSKQIAQFVTTIKNAEQQVGEHIIAALQHKDTVAVLTTVTIGPEGQQLLVSAALDPKRMKQVQDIMRSAEREREPEDPCVGFHCLMRPKKV